MSDTSISNPDTPRTNEREFHSGCMAGQYCVTSTFARTLERDNANLLRIIEAANLATQAECTCGGKPANDASACPACRVYHRIEAAKAANR